jgi:hypothetical protein
MGADAGSIARLSRLLSEGSLDSNALGQRASEIAALMSRWQGEQGLPRSELIVLGVNLHAYYTAFETLLSEWRACSMRRSRQVPPGIEICCCR